MMIEGATVAWNSNGGCAHIVLGLLKGKRYVEVGMV